MASPWNGTLVRSRFFDAISLLLPAAERFLVDTLDAALKASPRAFGPPLRGETERFLREERTHRRVHLQYNERLIEARPSMRATVGRAARVVDGLDRLDPASRLALAAAFERLTAVLSREAVERPYLLGDGRSNEARIWRWHAHEELGHCSVMTEAVRAVGVGRPLQVAWYVGATAFLLFDLLRFWWALCRCDIAAGAGRVRTTRDAASFVLRGLPSLLRMAGGWIRELPTTTA